MLNKVFELAENNYSINIKPGSLLNEELVIFILKNLSFFKHTNIKGDQLFKDLVKILTNSEN